MRKRLLLVISFLALLGGMLPGQGILAGPEATPHEDPALAKEEIISLPMVLHYGDAYELADLMKYLEADFKIGEMDFATIPPQLSHILERFNSLSSDIFLDMGGADQLIQQAASLLEGGELDQARQALSEAGQSSDAAQQLINEVLAAADLMGDRLGVFAGAASPELRLAYQALLGKDETQARQLLREAGLSDAETEQILNKVATEPGLVGDKIGAFSPISNPKLKGAYERLLENILKLREFNLATLDPSIFDEVLSSLDDQQKETLLEQKALLAEIAAKEKTLIPTEITLEVAPLSVFVGDSVMATGWLTAQGEPLGGKTVTVTLEGTAFNAQTEADGSYLLQITIPYNYVHSMTLVAAYSPAGADINIYRGCQSEPVTIETLFYETELEVDTPLRGSPGLPLTLGGRVTSTGPAIARPIDFSIDDAAWAQEITAGDFAMENMLPGSLAPGQHVLTGHIAPDRRYAGVSREFVLEVVLLPVEAELDVPSWAWAPQRLTLRGHVHSGAADVAGAAVGLAFRGETLSAVTGADGRFAMDIDIPFGVSLAGPQDLSFSIDPAQPYYDSLTGGRRIFTFNLAGLGLILAALVALALNWRRLRRYLDRWQQARRQAKTVPEAILVPEIPMRQDLPLPLQAAVRETGPRGRVVAAYLDALRAVERTTRTSMTQHMTLREFLVSARAKLSGDAAGSFARLTSVTEVALYSGYSIGDELAQEARRLAAAIKAGNLT